MAVSPQTVVGKVMGSVLSPNMSTGLEIKSPGANMKASPTNVPQLGPQMPNDAWLQVHSLVPSGPSVCDVLDVTYMFSTWYHILCPL